jgi:hemerythrin-like domain-containing protein
MPALHALESLQRDHRLLYLLSDALEAYGAALLADRSVRRGDLGALARAFRSVTDHRQFEKEEEVLQQILVRKGFNWNLESLLHARETHHKLRHFIDVLERAAWRDPGWSRLERRSIAETALDLASEQRKLAVVQEIELFPQILTRLEPMVLAELTEELARFDRRSERHAPVVHVPALCLDVTARYGSEAP